jgi:hypothetical protein
MRARLWHPVRLLLLLALAPPPAAGATERFVFPVSGQRMIPPTDSPASGSGDLIYDPRTTSLQGYIYFGALRGPLIALHIHGPAGPTEVGPLVDDIGATRHILLSYLPHNLVGALELEQLYVDVHTAAYPDGEERGQILHATSDLGASAWAAVKALFR